ncbi:mitochondrial carrier [Fragilariopsis cylindrus CCMP1102]|uniref:Mitochondrial carrier n=1 Tax=Fragilariopsis cylindrus CCMP1102 TaxID=635003 RepID=A0A1E7EQV4_9STRA|nr:mitochondrial carrier [Fragilariopsis cylindrus CCMP1102]|eukprot:OEU07933.1 mitochondrial carrier [Fragilariopsis cylindrus CCMP1102]
MSDSVLEPRAVTRDLFSAAIGSVLCCYVGQPFDTIKVKMQTNPDQFSHVVGSTNQILKNEGVAAFWKGAVPTAGGMVLENCMAFGVNAALKRAFPDTNNDGDIKEGPPSLLKPFAMGAITGCCSATVLLPSEIIKCKTQISTERHITSSQIVKQMMKKQGMRSFFVGFDAQLCRDSCFYALFFGGYELSCYTFRTFVPSMPDELNYFMSGGIAGMGAWFVAMPFDVPKTNVQSRYDTKVMGSYFPELIRVAKQRGIGGLYAGLGPTLIRAFPANAALFLGVESGKKLFDKAVWQE